MNRKQVVTGILFFGFVVFMAGWERRELLVRIQELSLFLPDRWFFTEHLLAPGDFLRYAGAWLACFFYYPWLGAGLLGVLLTGLQLLVYKSFSIPRKYYFLSFVPSLILLFSILQLDYVIFYQSRAELLFSQPLGLLFSLGLFYVTSLIRKPGRRFGVSAVVLLLYPLLGFYALLSGLLLWIREWKQSEKMNLRLQIVAGILLLTIPLLSFFFCYERLNVFRIYTSGAWLLHQLDGSWRLWLPFPVLFLLLLSAAALFPRTRKPEQSSTFTFPLNITVLAAFCFVLFCFVQRNPNFYRLLKIQQAIKTEDWDGILEQAGDKQPDRALYLYRNLALWKKGRLCEELFHYPLDVPPPETGIMLVRIVGVDLYSHYGQVGHAYRWVMENMVLNGVKTEYLADLLKLSVLKGESALAAKYYNLLRRTLFHGEEAEKYRKYIVHPDDLGASATLSAIRELMPVTDVLGEESSYVEPFILNCLRNMPVISFETLELRMSAALLLKKEELFRELLEVYRSRGIPLPRHVQEAALLFIAAGEEFDAQNLRIDEKIIRRYDEFVGLMQHYRHNEELLSQKTREYFGNTYWCYYLTVKKLAVI